VNEGLIQKWRGKVSVRIAALLDEAKNELNAVSGDGNLRTQCLKPLEQLLKQAQKQESIAHLNQSEQQAMRAIDGAIEKIEIFVKKPPVKEETANDPPVEKPKVTVKPRCILKPAELVTTPYLETSDDIEAFLKELRERLEKAIQTGQRIKIR